MAAVPHGHGPPDQLPPCRPLSTHPNPACILPCPRLPLPGAVHVGMHGSHVPVCPQPLSRPAGTTLAPASSLCATRLRVGQGSPQPPASPTVTVPRPGTHRHRATDREARAEQGEAAPWHPGAQPRAEPRSPRGPGRKVLGRVQGQRQDHGSSSILTQEPNGVPGGGESGGSLPCRPAGGGNRVKSPLATATGTRLAKPRGAALCPNWSRLRVFGSGPTVPGRPCSRTACPCGEAAVHPAPRGNNQLLPLLPVPGHPAVPRSLGGPSPAPLPAAGVPRQRRAPRHPSPC